jgi:hypothetical protein
MEDDETARMSDAELREFFGQMFPHGFAGADVVREIAPSEWKSSPLFACFHPSPEQVLAELLRMHRVSQELSALSQNITVEEPECPAVVEPTIEQVLAEWDDHPVNLTDEVTEIVGESLWDIFSDNHNVVAADGRVVDIGSFRAASAFLDQYLAGSKIQWDAGHMSRFYMGSIWISGRADLTPVYRMIFRRLKLLGADWEYFSPLLHLVDLSHLSPAAEKKQGPYSPSEAFARDQEERQQQVDLEHARAELEDAHKQARREAMAKPPPATVRAYQQAFDRNPKGWPPG